MELALPPRSTPVETETSPPPLDPAARTEALIEALRGLARAGDLATIRGIVHRAARQLSRADDTAFIVLGRSLHRAAARRLPASPGTERQRALEAHLGSWAMRHRRVVAIPDTTADDRVPTELSDPTPVRSLVMVPVRTHEPIGAIGASWADRHKVLDSEIHVLQALADSTAMALENLHLTDAVEARIAERTATLMAANRRLDSEVRERTRAEEASRVLAFTDDLTGLYNRRGFMELATAVRRSAASTEDVEQLVFVDIDGLKAVNDHFGHLEGDRLLRCTAEVLRDTFGEEDVLARIGGDEFTVYRSRTSVDPHHLVDRIEAATECRNRRGELAAPLVLSIGVASATASEGTTLDAFLARSDMAMYTHKRAKRGRDVTVGRFQTRHVRDPQPA